MRRLPLAVYYRICIRYDFREPMRYHASDGNSVTTFAPRSFASEGDSSCRTQGNVIKERRVRVEKDYLSLCWWRASSLRGTCRCRRWRQCPNTRLSSDMTAGISHLAASAGAKCILLFGPADPDVWAPMNKNVNVLRVPSRKVNDLG